MTAAPSRWPRRRHDDRGAVTMTAAPATMTAGAVTMTAAQSLWRRRRHYAGGAVTMTAAARHGPRAAARRPACGVVRVFTHW